MRTEVRLGVEPPAHEGEPTSVAPREFAIDETSSCATPSCTSDNTAIDGDYNAAATPEFPPAYRATATGGVTGGLAAPAATALSAARGTRGAILTSPNRSRRLTASESELE